MALRGGVTTRGLCPPPGHAPGARGASPTGGG